MPDEIRTTKPTDTQRLDWLDEHTVWPGHQDSPMPIADVHVGMRLRSICQGHHNQIVVTSLTERGFRYKIADDEEVINPHWSMRMERDGHECFALNGLCWWEPVLQ